MHKVEVCSHFHQLFVNVVASMNSNAAGGGSAMVKPSRLMEPLPTLNLVPSVEKLDAGLRSLDHCELHSSRISSL